jgi:hypothetical protein
MQTPCMQGRVGICMQRYSSPRTLLLGNGSITLPARIMHMPCAVWWRMHARLPAWYARR